MKQFYLALKIFEIPFHMYVLQSSTMEVEQLTYIYLYMYVHAAEAGALCPGGKYT